MVNAFHVGNGHWQCTKCKVEYDNGHDAEVCCIKNRPKWTLDQGRAALGTTEPNKLLSVGPAHYTDLAIEPWEIMEKNFAPAEFEGFLRGNVLKYLLRYQAKNGIEDLRKAQHYLGRLIQLKEE